MDSIGYQHVSRHVLHCGPFYGACGELQWHLAYKLELIAEILIFIVRGNVKQRPQVILGWRDGGCLDLLRGKWS